MNGMLMARWRQPLRILTLVAVFGVAVQGQATEAEQEAQLSARQAQEVQLEREELELAVEEARRTLDEAAARLGELHGKLYAIETTGKHGKKPMLGVLIGHRGPNGGLELVGVTPGGGAESAGLKVGDELTSINHLDLTGADSAMATLKEAMREVTPGAVVPVGYYRDGSVSTVNVTTQARGVYFMRMTGVPDAPDADFEFLDTEKFEEMAGKITEKFENAEFTLDTAWVENLEALENLESLESLQAISEMSAEVAPMVSRVVHRAIRIGGGLRLEDVDADLGRYFGVDEGVLVVKVPDVAAATVGDGALLKAGDILLAVDGNPLNRARDGYRALLGARGDQITVEVMRHGARESLSLNPEQFGAGKSITLHDNTAEDMEVPELSSDSR